MNKKVLYAFLSLHPENTCEGKTLRLYKDTLHAMEDFIRHEK
jgi:hypothetical protein